MNIGNREIVLNTMCDGLKLGEGIRLALRGCYRNQDAMAGFPSLTYLSITWVLLNIQIPRLR